MTPAALKESKPAAGGNGENLGDSCRASDGNMFAGGQDGGGGHDVGIVVAGFRGIHGGADGGNFAQAHLRDGIKQSGINLQTFGVDDLRVLRNVDLRADGGDFAVANDQGAVFDGRSREGEYFCVDDGVGLWSLRLRRQDCRAKKGRSDEPCAVAE